MQQQFLLSLVLLCGLLLFATTTLQATSSASWKVTTIAGGGSSFGDGSLATLAQLNEAGGISFGPNGDLYIADSSNHRIRMVSALNGTISTIAGTGTAGYSGDSGLATSATLNYPRGIFVTDDGEVYVADASNHRIRKISNGIISTVAGTGTASYSGDGGQATSANISPLSVTVFNGSLYFADMDNNRIRKVSLSDGIISTIAGNGNGAFAGDGSAATSASLNGPSFVAFTSNGDMYITDAGNNRIRKVSAIDGIISTIAGNGDSGFCGDGVIATSSCFTNAQGITFGSNGDILIADMGNHRVRRISISDNIISTFIGTGTSGFSGDGGLATSANIGAPRSVIMRVESGQTDAFYFSDGDLNRVRRVFASCAGSATLSSGVCVCPQGYFGDECQGYYCSQELYNSSMVCSSQGLCISPNNCSCQSGYYGDNCQYFDCYSIPSNNSQVCSSHGQCNAPNNCSCQGGFYGANCSNYDCFGTIFSNMSACSSHGLCSSPNNCTCGTGYYGNNCESFSCFGVDKNSQPCNGYGLCISPDICACSNNYYGSNCTHYQCSGVEFNSTNVCSGKGQCTKPNTCLCNSNYYGSNCEMFDCNEILFNSSSVCSGNGTCLSPNNCSCKTGHYGMDCQSYNCFGFEKSITGVCQNNGYCLAPDTCQCKNGYYGYDCSLFQCFGSVFNSTTNSVCSGNGYCYAPDKCACSSNYYGSTCEIFNCFGMAKNNSNVCSGKGSCILPDTCTCNQGYSGQICADYDCFGILKNSSTVCSTHGSCVAPNNCSCQGGYYGSDCSNYDCFGVQFNNTVCNGHGSCLLPDNCTCQSGYFGPKCESHSCYGTIFNNSNVCSARGQCVSPNNCQCEAGYFGMECEDFGCFGFQKNSSSVCSKHGSCSGPNNCSCKAGYHGFDCSIHDCFGIQFNDTLNVCNGHGSCLLPDNCTCQSGYFGAKCDLFNCFSMLFHDTNVCSGKGECTSFNNCSCLSGFTSSDCSVDIRPFEIILTKTQQTIQLESETVKNASVEIQVLDNSLKGHNISYFWTCLDCDGSFTIQIDTSKLSIFVNDATQVGNYTFIANSSSENRKSNNLVFSLVIKYDLNAPTLETFNLPSVLVSGLQDQTLSTIINSISLNRTTIKTFLSCYSNCSTQISYTWSVKAGYFYYESSSSIVANYNGANQIVFSPFITIQTSIPSNYLNESVVLTVAILNNKKQSITSSVVIQVISPAKPTLNSTSIDNLINVQPKTGISMNDKFTITVLEWTAASQLLPLSYAVGYYDKKKSREIRLTDYSLNTTFTTYLPYIRSTSNKRNLFSMEDIQLVVFTRDALGNILTENSTNVSVSPFNGTQEEYVQIVASLGGESLLIAVLDQTFTTQSNALISALISNVVIDPKNPSSALSSLESLTSNNDSLSSQTVSQVISKVDSFISNLTSQYLSDIELYGYVKSSMSNSNIMTTIQIISNCFSTFYSSEQIKSTSNLITSLIYLGTIPTALDASSSKLPSTTYKTELITITVSSFYLSIPNKNLQTISDNTNSVALNLTLIMTKYDAFSTTCGATMIAYSKNTNFDSSIANLTVSSNVNDFKFMKKIGVLVLEELPSPIVLSFSVVTAPLTITLNSTTNNTYHCKFWDETLEVWSDKGCSLFGKSSNSIECACNHTTMFTTFLESKTTKLTIQLRDEVASLYYAQISFGILYLLVASSILIGLIVMRKSQPVSSRLLTPYVGLIALIVECVLIYIVQRSVLVNQLISADTQMWEVGDTAANYIANIVMIIVNTLNLTAIFCYVLQVFRFQFMKLLYQKLSENRTEEQSKKVLKALKYSTSQPLFYSLIIIFACLNVGYWIIWVALRRTDIISATEYTYIVSISYSVCILTFGLIIAAVAIFDMALSSKKQIETNKKRHAINFSEQRMSLKLDGFTPEKKERKNYILSFIDWVTILDGPLYFRIEMIIYIVSFILLILNQVIGLSSLSYRFESLQLFKIALNIDSISFIFEVLYVISYMLVFGGYALIVAIIYKIKKQKAQESKEKKQNEELMNQELYNTLESDEGYEAFAKFCEKEFSTENLYIFSDLKKNEQIIQGDNPTELSSFVERVYETYIKVGATYEVNIPSKSRNSFLNLYQTLCNNDHQPKVQVTISTPTVSDCFTLMTKQVVMNLGDTFSRFVFTPEYINFKAVKDTQLQIMEKASVVYGI